MKHLIIVVLLLLSLNSISQSIEIEIAIDPIATDKAGGVDITVGIYTNQLIKPTLFRLGALIEIFPTIDYYSTHVVFDYPISIFTPKLIISSGFELGFIFRGSVPIYTYDLKQGTGNAYYTSFGANFKTTYWFDKIGLTARVNIKTRPDITARWGSDADGFRHSGYVGVVIPLNKSKDIHSEYILKLFQ